VPENGENEENNHEKEVRKQLKRKAVEVRTDPDALKKIQKRIDKKKKG
jgi:hypothetical protein